MLNTRQVDILEYVITNHVRVKIYPVDELKPIRGRIVELSEDRFWYKKSRRGERLLFFLKDLYYVDYSNKEDINLYQLKDLFPDRVNPEKFNEELNL